MTTLSSPFTHQLPPGASCILHWCPTHHGDPLQWHDPREDTPMAKLLTGSLRPADPAAAALDAAGVQPAVAAAVAGAADGAGLIAPTP